MDGVAEGFHHLETALLWSDTLFIVRNELRPVVSTIQLVALKLCTPRRITYLAGCEARVMAQPASLPSLCTTVIPVSVSRES